CALYAETTGLLELRPLPSGAQVFCHWNDEPTITACIENHCAENIFFGVAKRRDDTSGALENCVQLTTLFVDQDFKTTPESEARRKLAECPWPPSIIVESGGGLHVYWLMRESLDLTVEAERSRDLLRRLAHLLGADMSAAEPARILRVPG